MANIGKPSVGQRLVTGNPRGTRANEAQIIGNTRVNELINPKDAYIVTTPGETEEKRQREIGRKK